MRSATYRRKTSSGIARFGHAARASASKRSSAPSSAPSGSRPAWSPATCGKHETARRTLLLSPAERQMTIRLTNLASEREPTGCLGEDAVLRLLQRTATPAEAAAVHEHLAGCAACRRFVAEASEALFEDGGPPVAAAATDGESIGLSPPADGPGAPTLAPGAQVSRYVIKGLIGAGAGGTVYEAHDPHLGRLVALKLIRRTVRHALPRSEEQALGRLSHPNVVAVHDAGSFEGQTFMVMELVEGTTLDQWLEERPRHLDEILEVFV